MFTGHVYHTDYSVSSICSSSYPLQQGTPPAATVFNLSPPPSCHGCKAIDADGVRVHSLARVPAVLGLRAGRRVREREQDVAAQMCLCPDVPVPRCVWVSRAGFMPCAPAQQGAFGCTEQRLECTRETPWGCLAVGKEPCQPFPDWVCLAVQNPLC